MTTQEDADVMKRVIVFSNWKMNKKLDEARDFIKKLVTLLGKRQDIIVIMCIPYTYIGPASSFIKDSCIEIGSENMHAEEWGEFTGEISAPMLVSVGCTHVLLGHSERRKYFDETDEEVGRKMISALKNGLTPIVCIGETLPEKDSGRTLEILDKQIRVCLQGITPSHRCFVAYEPRWAIGTGMAPEYGEIEKTHLFIRKKIGEYYGEVVSGNTETLYGGSVTADNSYKICSLNGVDGVGFGGCSLDFDCFTKGIEEAARTVVRTDR